VYESSRDLDHEAAPTNGLRVKPLRFPPLVPDSQSMLHLDALRILGAAAIVVFHFNRFLDLDGRWRGVDDTVKSFSLIVDLFFLISGYVMAAVYGGRLDSWARFGSFLQKRVARLGPLHWATLAVFVAIAAAGQAGWVNDRDPSRYDLQCLVPNIVFIQAWGVCHAQTYNFVSWAISAEMGLYLVLPLLLWVAARGTPWLLLGAAASGIGLWAVSRHGAPFHQWTYDFGVLRAVPGFLLGMAAFGLRGRLGKLPAARWVMWGLVAAFVVASSLGAPRTALLLLIYAVGLAGVAADAAGPVGPVTRRLAPWAQLSFTLYMLHPIALKVALNWVGLGMLHLNGDAMRLWCLAWGLALVPISYLSLILFERPARDWIAGLGRHRAATASTKAGSSPIDPNSL
jgi:peptidoglycan/LPS O-acetylase OafA/YrhL